MNGPDRHIPLGLMRFDLSTGEAKILGELPVVTSRRVQYVGDSTVVRITLDAVETWSAKETLNLVGSVPLATDTSGYCVATMAENLVAIVEKSGRSWHRLDIAKQIVESQELDTPLLAEMRSATAEIARLNGGRAAVVLVAAVGFDDGRLFLVGGRRPARGPEFRVARTTTVGIGEAIEKRYQLPELSNLQPANPRRVVMGTPEMAFLCGSRTIAFYQAQR